MFTAFYSIFSIYFVATMLSNTQKVDGIFALHSTSTQNVHLYEIITVASLSELIFHETMTVENVFRRFDREEKVVGTGTYHIQNRKRAQHYIHTTHRCAWACARNEARECFILVKVKSLGHDATLTEPMMITLIL